MPDTSSLKQSDPVVGTVDASGPLFDAGDLTGARRDRIAPRVREACRHHGFFYVNLDVQQCEAVDRTLDSMRTFFAIPDTDERKQRVRRGDNDSGWVPQFTEPAYQPGTVSSLEAFDCDRADIDGRAARDTWPQLEGFRQDVSTCWQTYTELAAGILDVLGRAVGISPDFFVHHCRTQELNTMRLLHYAAMAEAGTANQVGISAHTDFECITLLYQQAPGLELTAPDGSWFDAPHSGGRLVVLLGDMLERWTNGYLRATGHRVRQTAEQRFSIVMFVAVDEDVEVAPLSKFVTASSPALYAPIAQAEHIRNEMNRARGNSAAA